MAKDTQEQPELLGPTDMVPGDALDALRSGAVITKIEDSRQFAIAIQHPRDPERILAQALKELDIVPELAARKFYVIPYKNHRKGCVDRRNCDCPSKPIEGPSIKAAQELANHWGNCRVSCNFEETTDDLHATATFTDFQHNVVWEFPVTVSKVKEWHGKVHRLDKNDPLFVKELSINVSKAMRNAIFRGLPDWLVHSYYMKCRELAAGGGKPKPGQVAKPMQDRVKDCIAAFKKLSVATEQLENYLGKPLAQMTNDDLADMIGIHNAIRDGQTTADEAFGGPVEPTGAAPPPSDDIKF